MKQAAQKSESTTRSKPSGGNLAQHQSGVLDQVQQQAGNQAVQGYFLQAKLAVSEPDDPYEQEADQVAAKVMRMPTEKPVPPRVSRLSGGVQGKCSTDAEEQGKPSIGVHRKSHHNSDPHAVKNNTSDLASAIRGGRSLSRESKALFEPRFGQNLSGVRVHTDGASNQMARDLNARAFTTGSHIVFAGGEYQPTTTKGKTLLAHELTHCLQQSQNESFPLIQRTPDDELQIRGLPTPEELQRIETAGSSATGINPLGEQNATLMEQRDDESSIRQMHTDFMVGDDNGGIRSITLFTITETPVEETANAHVGMIRELPLPQLDPGETYPIHVTYERAIVYLDVEGRQITALITGDLAFTPADWETLIGGEDPESFTDVLHRQAAVGKFKVVISGKNQAQQDIEISYLSQETDLNSQVEVAAQTLGLELLLNPSWYDYASDENLAGFLDPRTSTAAQYASLRQFLEGVEEDERRELQDRLTPELADDIAAMKDILLDEWIDSEQEDELMELVRKWSRNRDIVAPSGSSYFDEFLNELRNSRWHRDYGLFDGGSTSFYDSLTEEVEEQAGDLTTLIAQNSIEHGAYAPQWHYRGEDRAINKELVERSATHILDGLESYTSDDDIRVISSTITGLPGPEQGAVLSEIMSRYDEKEYWIFARYGEAAPEKMLYYLFEDLDDDARKAVGDSLVNNGTMERQQVNALTAGRGLLGEYLPATHHHVTEAGRSAAEYYADNLVELEGSGKYGQQGLNYLGGGLASLADPENLQTTVTVLGTAGLAPAVAPRIAAIHPLAESGMLVAGSGFAGYGVGKHGREVITGETAEGQQLNSEERLASGLLTMSNALFLAAPLVPENIGAGMNTSMVARAQNRYAAGKFSRGDGMTPAGPVETQLFSNNLRAAMNPRYTMQTSQLRMSPEGELFNVHGALNSDMVVMNPVTPGLGRPVLSAAGQTGTSLATTGRGGGNTKALAPSGQPLGEGALARIGPLIYEPFTGPNLMSPTATIISNPGSTVLASEGSILPNQPTIDLFEGFGGQFQGQTFAVPTRPIDMIQTRFPRPHSKVSEELGIRLLNQGLPLTPENMAVADANIESVTRLGPHALEHLRPGGTMDVVFYEQEILGEIAALGELTHTAPDGITYRLQLVGEVQTVPRQNYPHSGFGVPTTDNVSRVILQKVPLAPQALVIPPTSVTPGVSSGPTDLSGFQGEVIVDLQAGRPNYLRAEVAQRPGSLGVGIEAGDWMLGYQGIHPTYNQDHAMARLLVQNAPRWPATTVHSNQFSEMTELTPEQLDPQTHLFPHAGEVVMLRGSSGQPEAFFPPYADQVMGNTTIRRLVPTDQADVTGVQPTTHPQLHGRVDRMYWRRPFALQTASASARADMGREINSMLRDGGFVEFRLLASGDRVVVAELANQIEGAVIHDMNAGTIQRYLGGTPPRDATKARILSEAGADLQGEHSPLGIGGYRRIIRIYKNSGSGGGVRVDMPAR